MAVTKKASKISKPVIRQKPIPEQVKNTVHQISDEVTKLARQAKEQFNRLDDRTKQKVIAGLSGIAALLALSARHHHRKKHHQN